jgi:hypothetical protein
MSSSKRTRQAQQALLTLLNELEIIGKEHEELYDTDCRDPMSDEIWGGFLKPEIDYRLCDDFGLYDPIGNQMVKAAIQQYLTAMSQIAAKMTFHQRLAAFQDENLRTSTNVRLYYDDFFGWRNPDEFDYFGDWGGFNNKQSNRLTEQTEDEPTIDESIFQVDGQLNLFDTSPYQS